MRLWALDHQGGWPAPAVDPAVGTTRHDGRAGTEQRLRYDYLMNATGPRLKFEATEGLGPDAGFSHSVCTADHATGASAALDQAIERMRGGEPQTLVVGMGHGTCTCEGAAFEYIVNLEFELRHRGVRDRADITWITNEYELGDFGMGGMHLRQGGFVTPSSVFNASIFAERGIDWITRAHVSKVEAERVLYETLDGGQWCTVGSCFFGSCLTDVGEIGEVMVICDRHRVQVDRPALGHERLGIRPPTRLVRRRLPPPLVISWSMHL